MAILHTELMRTFIGQQFLAVAHIIIARHDHRRVAAFHLHKLTMHGAAEIRAAATGRFMPGIKPSRALVAEPYGSMVRMIMPLTFALLHRERPRHLIPARPDHRPQKGLVRLTNHIPRKQLPVILHRHPGLGFLNGKPVRPNRQRSQQNGCTQINSNPRFHA